MPAPLYKAVLQPDFIISPDDLDALSNALDGFCLSCSIQKDVKSGWSVEWLFDDPPDIQDLTDHLSGLSVSGQTVHAHNIRIETVPDRDWLDYSYQKLEPFTAGPFFIYGAHADQPVPDGRIGLEIEAATAFGSGTHGTTASCLQSLQLLQNDSLTPGKILDMGTGSGILAVAAAKLWPSSTLLACDIEDDAVHLARRHAQANHTGHISCFQSDGFPAS